MLKTRKSTAGSLATVSGEERSKAHEENHTTKWQRHGMTGAPIYNVWVQMRQRCHNPRNKDFNHYGGRGIAVCVEWRNSFPVFHKWAKKAGYAPGLSIDRIDNDSGYSPDNCRWVTMAEQLKNRRAPTKPHHWKNVGLPRGVTVHASGRYQAFFTGKYLFLFGDKEEMALVEVILTVMRCALRDGKATAAELVKIVKDELRSAKSA